MPGHSEYPRPSYSLRVRARVVTETRLTLTVKEAATMLGISKNLAYELARRGELPGAIKLGHKRIVVSKVQLERILQGERVQNG